MGLKILLICIYWISDLQPWMLPKRPGKETYNWTQRPVAHGDALQRIAELPRSQGNLWHGLGRRPTDNVEAKLHSALYLGAWSLLVTRVPDPVRRFMALCSVLKMTEPIRQSRVGPAPGPPLAIAMAAGPTFKLTAH